MHHFVYDLTVALTSVHERKVVHQDVTPANLLRFGDVWYLNDFGCSMMVEEGERVTEGGVLINERVRTHKDRAPPEMQELTPPLAHDERADVYFAGYMIKELMKEGRVPDVRVLLAIGRSPIRPYVRKFVGVQMDTETARRLRILRSMMNAKEEADRAGAYDVLQVINGWKWGRKRSRRQRRSGSNLRGKRARAWGGGDGGMNPSKRQATQ